MQLLKNKQFLSFAGNMVMAILNLVTMGLLYRHLSKGDMDCYVIFTIIFILIDTVRSGLLQTSFVKFYAGTSPERADNILGSTWYFGLLITGTVVLINIGGVFLVGRTTDLGIITMVKWTGLLFIATFPIVMATWLLQAQHRYMEILYIRIVNQVSFFLTIISLIFFHVLTLDRAMLANVATCALTCIVVFGFRWTGVRKLPKQTRAAVIEIYNFGKFSMGTSISSNLLKSSDSIIIKFALPEGSLAIYNVAQSLMNVIEIPLRSFVTTAMTSLSAAQNNKRKEEVEYIFKKYAGALTIIFTPVVLGSVLFADIAVSLLGGGKYVGGPAANIFRIFMIFAIFFPLDRFTGVTLDVIHQPRINFYKVLAMLAINVTGDFVGIYFLHSIYGVGLASIPTFVLGTMIGYFSLKVYLRFTFVDILKLGWAETKILIRLALGKFSGKLGI